MVLVMYLGRIVESARGEDLWRAPFHPYTRALLAAVPDPARRGSAAPLHGELPSPEEIPGGCRFHPRCSWAQPLCATNFPPLVEISSGHSVTCHRAHETPPTAA